MNPTWAVRKSITEKQRMVLTLNPESLAGQTLEGGPAERVHAAAQGTQEQASAQWTWGDGGECGGRSLAGRDWGAQKSFRMRFVRS